MSEATSAWPVIESLAEAEKHDHELPALVPVPGHLVRPIIVLTEKLFALDPYGDLARGIEMQLVGLAEPDSSCILLGIRDATSAAAQVVKSADEVAVEVAEADEDEADAQASNQPPSLRVVARNGQLCPPTLH